MNDIGIVEVLLSRKFRIHLIQSEGMNGDCVPRSGFGTVTTHSYDLFAAIQRVG